MNSWPVGGEVDLMYNGKVVGTVTVSNAETGAVVATAVLRDTDMKDISCAKVTGYSIGPFDLPMAPTV